MADDHAVVRRGVLQILSEKPNMVAAGEASTGREALQAVQKADYDVVMITLLAHGSSPVNTPGGSFKVTKG